MVQLILRRFILAILLLQASLSFGAAKSTNSCNLVYTRSSVLKAIGNVTEPAYTPKNQVVRLKRTKVKNQCNAEECYLFAGDDAFEQANANFQNRPDAPLFSPQYTFMKKLYDITNTILTKGPDHTDLSVEGGEFHEDIRMSQMYGLMPQQSFTPTIPFHLVKFEKFYKEYNSLSKRLYKKVSALNKNSNDYQESLADGISQLRAVIEKYMGPEPSNKIKFRGQETTTQEIAKLYGIPRGSTLYFYFPKGRWDYDEKRTFFKDVRKSLALIDGKFVYGEVDEDQMTDLMKKQIDAKAPVVMDITWPDPDGTVDGHEIVLTGYELKAKAAGDPKNYDGRQIKRGLILNSWGRTWSDHGSAWYRTQDIHKNLSGIWFWAPPKNWKP